MRNILLGILLGFVLLFGCVEEETPMMQPPIESPDEP